MHPKNDVRKNFFFVATPITLSAMSWMVEIWTPEKHQKCDPKYVRGEPPITLNPILANPNPNPILANPNPESHPR